MIVLWRIEIGGIIRDEYLKKKNKGVKPIGGFTPLRFCAATVNPPRRCDPWRRMPDSP